MCAPGDTSAATDAAVGAGAKSQYVSGIAVGLTGAPVRYQYPPWSSSMAPTGCGVRRNSPGTAAGHGEGIVGAAIPTGGGTGGKTAERDRPACAEPVAANVAPMARVTITTTRAPFIGRGLAFRRRVRSPAGSRDSCGTLRHVREQTAPQL